MDGNQMQHSALLQAIAGLTGGGAAAGAAGARQQDFTVGGGNPNDIQPQGWSQSPVDGKWYVRSNGDTYGPFDRPDTNQLGQVQPDSQTAFVMQTLQPQQQQNAYGMLDRLLHADAPLSSRASSHLKQALSKLGFNTVASRSHSGV